MKYFILAAMLLSTPALAQTTASVTAGTDYIARGTSQTYDKPAVMVYAEHQFENGLYIGGFAANVDFDDKTKAEADILAGYRKTVGTVNLDVGAIYITYHGKQPTNWNMTEFHVAASKSFGKLNATAYVGVSPNYFNYAGKSAWNELAVTYPLSDKLTASAAYGFQYIEKDVDYQTWNAGLSYALTKTLTVDAKYYDTDWKPVGVRYLDKIYAPRVVLSVRKAF